MCFSCEFTYHGLRAVGLTLQGAKDFLMRCFQKDPNLRTSAKKLRKHNWISNHVRQGSAKRAISESSSHLDYDDAVTSVREYNQKVNGPDLTLRASSRPGPSEKRPSARHHSPSKRNGTAIDKHMNNQEEEEDWTKDIEFGTSLGLHKSPLKLRSAASGNRVRNKNISSANWDDDFVESGSKPGLSHSRTAVPKLVTRQSMPIIPPNRPVIHKSESAAHLIARRSPERKPFLEELTIRPSSSQVVRNIGPSSIPGTPTSRTTSSLSNVLRKPSSLTDNLTPKRLQRTVRSSLPAGSGGSVRSAAIALQQYADGIEDYSDIVGELLPSTPTLSLKSDSGDFTKRSWLQDDDIGDDPFSEIEEFEKENLTANVLREQKARAINQMEQLMKAFQSSAMQEIELAECTRDIQVLLQDHPTLKTTIISSHGLLPLLETLEYSSEDDLTLSILELINLLAYSDEEVQENM